MFDFCIRKWSGFILAAWSSPWCREIENYRYPELARGRGGAVFSHLPNQVVLLAAATMSPQGQQLCAGLGVECVPCLRPIHPPNRPTTAGAVSVSETRKGKQLDHVVTGTTRTHTSVGLSAKATSPCSPPGFSQRDHALFLKSRNLQARRVTVGELGKSS